MAIKRLFSLFVVLVLGVVVVFTINAGIATSKVVTRSAVTVDPHERPAYDAESARWVAMGKAYEQYAGGKLRTVVGYGGQATKAATHFGPPGR